MAQPLELRLLHAHPKLTLGGVVSSSQAGEPVAKMFNHLAPAFPNETFVSLDAVIERAVKGMLPQNRLGRAMFKKLRVYRGAEHPHQAQQPTAAEL